MISKLFGTDKFMDLIASPSFWIGVAIVAILIVVVIYSFKYPALGKWVFAGVAFVGVTILTIYSGIQLNYYYNSKGGIYGAITGIFDTNKIEVVDNLTFEVKNIELLEKTDGVYSAGITVDKVISLNTQENLGVFVNGMPCDITSHVEEEYALANYVYTFYDDNQTAILTDTLILRFAFYENSTYLSLSTSGGAESVGYWHHYFNKNGFIVKIAPFDYLDEELTSGTGDVSNYAVVKYLFDGELYDTEVYKVGKTLNLPMINDTYYNWYVNNELVTEDYVVQGNIFVEAYTGDFIETYTVTFINGSDVIQWRLPGDGYEITLSDVTRDGWTFAGWSTDGTTQGIVDSGTRKVTEDVTYTAIFKRSVFTAENSLMFTLYNTENVFEMHSLDFSSACELSSLISSGYEFKVTLDYIVTFDSEVSTFDMSMTDSTYEKFIEASGNGYIMPLMITSDNKLLINTKDGSSAFTTFIPGQHTFKISDIEIYTK